MKVHFFEPKAADRVGGLDAAIDGLRGALTRKGVSVDGELPVGGNGDIAHFHGIWQPPHRLLVWRCARRGVPYVVSPHGMLEPWAWKHKRWKKWPYFHAIERPYLTRAAALLATAPIEAARLRTFFPGQTIAPLPLGLTGDARPDFKMARRALGWQPEERVLLFLSRIHVKKGLDLLLRALAKTDGVTKARLVIVGEGKRCYERELQQLATALAPTLPRIDWIGPVWGEARWKYFQGADLFCLPTHSENFGLAVLEACQVGTPVLTTVHTPWKDELADGRGLIGEPNVESLQRLLREFFAQPCADTEAREKLAAWAWARFHWDSLASRYIALYEEVLAAARTKRFQESGAFLR